MSRFSIGFARGETASSGTGPQRRGAPADVRTRVNANVRRQFSLFWGYVAILGFLSLVAAASMSAALWRLFHFAH